MTLTDREIAILHLALELAPQTEHDLERAKEHFRTSTEESDTPWTEYLESRYDAALALVPLYRHAFGIKAPLAEGQFSVEDFRDAHGVLVTDSCGCVFKDLGVPSPASLAIANALSRTR